MEEYSLHMSRAGSGGLAGPSTAYSSQAGYGRSLSGGHRVRSGSGVMGQLEHANAQIQHIVMQRQISNSDVRRSQQQGWLHNRGEEVAGGYGFDGGGSDAAAHLGQQRRQPDPAEEEAEEEAEEPEAASTFAEYRPSKLKVGMSHPDAVVETASLAAVEPPDITYSLQIMDLVGGGVLSALQLESIVYACQRHEQLLANGQRAGFFIGDGAGVGKGRTIAGLILENWRCGRRRHLWLSVGSDLRFDSRRDLDDVTAEDLEVHALNKVPYGRLDGPKLNIREGVVFLTYSSLISSSDKGQSRLEQLLEWCGERFDGLVVLDECHKAKNLIPDSGGRATKVGERVLDLQRKLPLARIVYCSATGASEPRNLGYMERLGLWGEGSSFHNFAHFLEAVGSRGMGALELVAMDMKAQGMYVARTLSYAGAEFEVVEAALEEDMAAQYSGAARMWNQLRREFLYAAEQAEAEPQDKPQKSRAHMLWRAFWATHQRFFRHMCMAAKVPALVRLANEALAAGKCVVIGLQSTGEARTADVVASLGEELDDFVSGPRELLLKLVEDYYPLPPNPNAEEEAEAKAAEALANGKVSPSPLKRGRKGAAQNGSVRKRAKKQAVAVEEAGDDDVVVLDDTALGAEPETSISSGPAQEADGSCRPLNGTGSGLKIKLKLPGATSSKQQQQEGTQQLEQRRLSHQQAGPRTSTPDNSRGSKRWSTSSNGNISEPYHHANNEQLLQQADHTNGPYVGGYGGKAPQNPSHHHHHQMHGRSLQQQQALQRMQQEEEERLATAAQMEALRGQQAEGKYRAAAERKEQVRRAIAGMELPNNPLDQLIDQLGGPDHVAEMTGRKGRLVRQKASAGVRWEARNASGVAAGAPLDMINVHERTMFLDGRKLIAVISEAASAGISLHADRRAANQKRRVHLTLELPWSADKAIQQFGRSHRANQAHGPQYRLMFTPLGGERRFAAAVARRLESLGALTQGDRRAGPSLSEFNYESVWGQKAVKHTYKAVLEEEVAVVLPPACRPGPGGEAPSMSQRVFFGRVRAHLLSVGIIRPLPHITAIDVNAFLSAEAGAPTGCGKISDVDKSDVPRFLNRLLGLEPEAQMQIFDFYQAVLEAVIEAARKDGKYDEGIVDVKGTSVAIVGAPQIVRTDVVTGAKTLLYRVDVDRGVSWQDAQAMVQESVASTSAGQANLAHPPSGSMTGFYRAKQLGIGGKVHMMLALQMPGGGAEGREFSFRLVRPATGKSPKQMSLQELQSRYLSLGLGEAEALWGAAYAEAGRAGMSGRGGARLRRLLLLSGLVLPVWEVVEGALHHQHRAADRRLHVLRIQTTGDNPRRLVGVQIPEGAVEEVLQQLSRLEHAQQPGHDGETIYLD